MESGPTVRFFHEFSQRLHTATSKDKGRQFRRQLLPEGTPDVVPSLSALWSGLVGAGGGCTTRVAALQSHLEWRALQSSSAGSPHGCSAMAAADPPLARACVLPFRCRASKWEQTAQCPRYRLSC